jgi:glycosyltransferase involved in cell wall biosynthesis
MEPEIVPQMVSTVVPVYNRSKMIRSAVASVLAQAYRPIEVVIVDDGSTDATVQVCEEIVRENGDTVRLLKQANRGPGPAREKGRLAARGEYIQYLDSDDLLLPDKFKDQVAVLQRNPDCGIAYGITRLIDASGEVLAEPFKWSGGDRRQLFPGLLVDRWWSTHTPLYRRSVCDKIGPWSDLRYSQDWEYDARAGRLQTRLVSTHTVVSEHRTHDGLRQTGTGKWLSPSDQVRFFRTLLQCAIDAGVKKSAPEMKHFSRWAFSCARKSGLSGDSESAEKLFEIAAEAAVAMDTKMRAYSFLTKVLGWKNSGRLAQVQDAFGSRRAGASTLKQSWMD